MRTFLNSHPLIALTMVGIIAGTAIKVADIIKTKSIIDKVDIIVVNKRNTDKKEDENAQEKVESVEE